MFRAVALPFLSTGTVAAYLPRQSEKNTRTSKAKKRPSSKGFGADTKELQWRCVEGCGACCKLAKDATFTTPEEIFTDPKDVQLYKSLIGPDGWCIHFEKSTRKCSIYSDRPYFCRVEPEVFHSLYGIDKKKFNKEACR
uniref:YkgJ family cysteine cluster protein n=1 Tax=Rhizophora mucronata TaxID=61149 RepID=A0A2P2JMV1_RHIMU